MNIQYDPLTSQSMRSMRNIRGLFRGGVIILLLLLAGCVISGGPEGEGGITIVENDTTPPSLSLQVVQQGSNSTVTVRVGEAGQRINLANRTGPVNLNATGVDSESGIQLIQIWVNKATTNCENNICTRSGPGLQSSPRFAYPNPPLSPGQTTSSTRSAFDALLIEPEIPPVSLAQGQSRTIEIIIHAVAVNYRGGQVTTPEVTLVWTDAG
jgi:hypothetical protein